jgi:anti-anti-sigma factor
VEFETREVDGRAAVIVPRGRLTMVSAPELKALVERAVSAGRTVVIVDLAETRFMDSSGLGALVGGLRSARTAGGDLRIARPTEQVSTVLELTTMDRVLRPFGSVEEALDG